MRGYLLDVNHVHAWENKNHGFSERLRKVPASAPMYVSAVAIGEIEWGHIVTEPTDTARRSEAKRFMVEHVLSLCLNVTATTADYYTRILAEIWRRHPPAKHRGTERHLVENGVDINDVWAVASAWEHGLVFLTRDGMPVIRESAPEVAFENWVA